MFNNKEFDTDKMDEILYADGLDWTFNEPPKGTNYTKIYIIEKKEESIKYQLTWLNGDDAEIYDTLDEAKEQVDKYRESHELDYGLIRTYDSDDGVVGEWGEYSEEWEYDDSSQEPKCAAEGCECKAAFNEYYPNSEGGQYWTLCEKCYEADQEE